MGFAILHVITQNSYLSIIVFSKRL